MSQMEEGLKVEASPTGDVERKHGRSGGVRKRMEIEKRKG